MARTRWWYCGLYNYEEQVIVLTTLSHPRSCSMVSLPQRKCKRVRLVRAKVRLDCRKLDLDLVHHIEVGETCWNRASRFTLIDLSSLREWSSPLGFMTTVYFFLFLFRLPLRRRTRNWICQDNVIAWTPVTPFRRILNIRTNIIG